MFGAFVPERLEGVALDDLPFVVSKAFFFKSALESFFIGPAELERLAGVDAPDAFASAGFTAFPAFNPLPLTEGLAGAGVGGKSGSPLRSITST